MASTTTIKELITLRISPRMRDEFRSIAERDDETVSAVIRELLRRGLEQKRESSSSNA